MAMPPINIDDCTFNYYEYYFNSVSTGEKSNNYLPIIVVDLPYSDAQMGVTPGDEYVYIPESEDMGKLISPLLKNHLPCVYSLSRVSGVVSSTYPWTSYKDRFFTGSVSVSEEENADGRINHLVQMELNFYWQSYANITGGYLSLMVGEPENQIVGAGLLMWLLRSTDGTLYYHQLGIYASRGGPHIDGQLIRNDIIAPPGPDKFGDITFIPPFNPWSGTYWTTAYSEILKQIIGVSKKIDIKDPNPGGGDSKPGGGGGDGDIGGDTNPDDGLPTISALDSGLLTAYNPSVKNLQDLGKFLWSDGFDVNTFKKLFNDPFDTLLGLSVVPVIPNTSGTKNIMFGNMDSGVSAPVVANQWVKKDMGSVTLNEVWRGALDYAPSTGVTIYLPFIGMRQLNVNDVMGSTLHLIYKFDVLTGACVAQIYVNHDHQGNKDDGFSWHEDQGLLYEFIGQCAENIPLASQDFTNTIRAAIGGVSVAAGAAASVATGNPALGMAALTVGMANAGMQASTPTVERGGHLSGSASIMGYSQPFLIVERPHQCKPTRYYALRGVPSQVYTSKLSECTGFTQITANNNLHVAGASDSELAELQNLLVAGVYFPDKKR